uniref:Neuropeptide-Like Protein n=1 Tax=Bursaphelenchus xylophilus TaxID=6326 RepID=A0A1I7RSW0_BURXY
MIYIRVIGGVEAAVPIRSFDFSSSIEPIMKFLAIFVALLVAVFAQQNPMDQMHLERVFEPYTYQRMNYDASRMAYNARYPNNNYHRVDGWQPATWDDIFGSRRYGRK